MRSGRCLLRRFALFKRYLQESDGEVFAEILASDPRWVTARITWIEVQRNLGQRVASADRRRIRSAFEADWRSIAVVEIDETLCADAAFVADLTGTRSLDAIHLAAARRVGTAGLAFVTANLRQAQAARSLGFATLGA